MDEGVTNNGLIALLDTAGGRSLTSLHLEGLGRFFLEDSSLFSLSHVVFGLLYSNGPCVGACNNKLYHKHCAPHLFLQ